MAGQYSYDPRPFYGQNSSYGLMPLDEVFYGRSEPVPYWMDQRMAPVLAFDDYYPGHKQMAMGRQQQYAYKRPETSRDDIGVDMYRRSPYNFHGVGYGAQQQPPCPRSQDDTWVRSGNHPHGHGNDNNNVMMNVDQYRHMDQGYMPISHHRGTDHMHGHIKTNNMTMGGNHGYHGNQGINKMSGSSNQFGKNSNGYENMKSSSQGVKSMKQGSNTKHQQRLYDSSSEDSDEEYENGSKWATKNSQVKQGNNKHHNVAHHSKSGKSKSGGHNNNNHNMNYGSSYNSTSSKKSHKSLISKLLRFQDGNSSSSDSDNEGYNTKKSSSKASNHGHQQNKSMQYGNSQYKGVELKVPLCCDNCEQKVKDCLEDMDGVESVLCDQWSRKVIVYGNVKPENVLKRVRRVKKTADLWQQVKQMPRAY